MPAHRAPDRQAAARAIEAFLRAIGRDPEHDPSLVGTGARVADTYIDELCDGYAVDVPALLGANVIEGSSELVSVRDIAVTTMCPHHLLPGEGHATVAFAPGAGGGLVGIGAIGTLVDAFAHRLTLQETIGEEVADALMTHLKAKWAGCRLTMSHACMCARGERRQGTRVESVALRGALTDAERTRAYLALGVGGLTP
jgi:GTP cyclohydrolase I